MTITKYNSNYITIAKFKSNYIISQNIVIIYNHEIYYSSNL